MANKNSRSSFSTVPDGASRSIAGPSVGFADVATSTTDESADLSDWAGTYVTIEAFTGDHFFAFSDVTGDTIHTTAAVVGTAMVPRTVKEGTSVDVVVPRGRPFLTYRTVTGAGVLRVTRS